MSEEDYTPLEAVRDIMEAQQSFFSMSRYLDGRTRSNLVAIQLRNTHTALGIVRDAVNTVRDITRRTTLIAHIPIDISGNFFDPVVVRPTQAQITAGTENHIQVPEDTICSICRDTMSCATRIRHCGHTFHHSCIEEWFSMNARCPVCRHDIRLQTPSPITSNETSRVHTDEE